MILRARALSAGLSISDLDLLTVGQLLDIFTEQHNDRQQYPVMGSASDLMGFM